MVAVFSVITLIERSLLLFWFAEVIRNTLLYIDVYIYIFIYIYEWGWGIEGKVVYRDRVKYGNGMLELEVSMESIHLDA